MKTLNVSIRIEEQMLGTCSGDPEIHHKYIASKSPDPTTIEDEVAAIGIDGVERKEMTVFPRDNDGTPFIYDYQIKGFFKDACGMLSRVNGTESKKLKAYKKIIDGLIFPQPRKIKITVFGQIGSCQRPLRAQTSQGERIALANSESIPAGSMITFNVLLLDESYEPALREWLEYGQLRGLCQWRNSGCGRFSVTGIRTFGGKEKAVTFGQHLPEMAEAAVA